MRNVPGYQSAPGVDDAEKGVFSAYMDLLYDTALVSFAGVEFSTNYPAGTNFDVGVPGIVNEVGALQGTGLPYGPSEKLLYKATFTASELGTTQFRSDPADDIPLHETTLNQPETQVNYPQIEFLATTIQVIESPDLVRVRLEATDLSGNSLSGKQITAGTEFYVKAWVDDLGLRSGGAIPASQEGVFSAYMDVNYNATLARPVTDANFAEFLRIRHHVRVAVQGGTEGH